MKILSITLIFLLSISAKTQDLSCVSLFQQSQVELSDEVIEGLYKLAEDQVRTQKLPMSESKNMILREIKRQVFKKRVSIIIPRWCFFSTEKPQWKLLKQIKNLLRLYRQEMREDENLK